MVPAETDLAEERDHSCPFGISEAEVAEGRVEPANEARMEEDVTEVTTGTRANSIGGAGLDDSGGIDQAVRRVESIGSMIPKRMVFDWTEHVSNG